MAYPYHERLMPPSEVARRFGAELLPCPFCGSLSVALFLSACPHVTCCNCEADGPSHEARGGNEDAQARAVQAWNRRVVTP